MYKDYSIFRQVMEGQVTIEEYLFGSDGNHSTILRNLINQLRTDYMPFRDHYTMPTRESPLFLTGHPKRPLPLDAFLVIEDNDLLDTLGFSDKDILRSQLNPLPSYKGLWLLRHADLLSRRFWRFNQKDDLEEVIWYYQNAVSLFPQTHYHFLEAILGLCSSVYQRFQLLGHLDDLTELLRYLNTEKNLDLESLLTPFKVKLPFTEASRKSIEQIRKFVPEFAEFGEFFEGLVPDVYVMSPLNVTLSNYKLSHIS